MTEVDGALRRRRWAEELCATTLRALSGDPGVHFRGWRLYRGPHALPAPPHLRPGEDDDFEAFRGTADGMALRLLGSDAALHRRLRPADGIARLVFELLEQFRVESLVPAALPGVARNVRERYRRWALGAHHAGLTETAAGLLVYTVAQVGRARVLGEPVLEETEDLIEATRAALAPVIGPELAGLRRTRDNQVAFGGYARALAEKVGSLLADAGLGGDGDETADAAPFAALLDFDDPADGGVARAGDLRERAPADGVGYRAFTAAYDREPAPRTLVRPELLKEFRETLDRRVAAQGVSWMRLARDLRTLLATPSADGWEGAQEEGYVDGRALSRLVSSPGEGAVFQVPRIAPAGDALVTFLIDCSGSMKEHRESVAALVDLFARALEPAGAACEILGFTTAAWHGGRARRDWERAGRPAAPGRLNERRHLVFKAAATPWHRARREIAALLKADLYREGADGEAVAWAAHRALARDERRKLLLVLSDGSPMDTATALANDEDYLSRHLTTVVTDLERRGAVEVLGLGVGRDPSRFYRRSHALGDLATPGYGACRDILNLLAGRRSAEPAVEASVD
ncbi:cobalt chelatase [Amycolatopsis sp. NPDC051903]|uniref:cobaltochelatase CobT-related protein n=1 Tax=Amycolatopsis sp. NPDC051903 TaxID=3363936 RepID=UPI003799242C